MDENIIEIAVARYYREYDRYKKLADLVYLICNEIVQKKLTIRATVQRRAKDPNSFQEKLRKHKTLTTVDEVFDQISDLAGVRIITYLESDREKVVEEIRQAFIGKDKGNQPIIKAKDKSEKGKHYRATHCQVYLPDEYLIGENENLKNTTCEIQVCSLLAHVYNEIEHDLQYKPLSGIISEQESELLDQLGLITKSGDTTIKRLLEATDERLKERTGDFDDVHDFVIRMREELKGESSFANNAGELYEELLLLKLTSPQTINKALTSHGETLKQIAEIEYNKLKKYIIDNNIDITLDDNSSDILLVALLRKKVNTIIANHPIGRGKRRPSRLLQIAIVYKEMVESV
ncbi:MAG: RelA/SpoT domain-containing protein [Bacteroidota bacterium]|nr:RelA/SpoT domain-containing protein [Bacteroidota bacterium]